MAFVIVATLRYASIIYEHIIRPVHHQSKLSCVLQENFERNWQTHIRDHALIVVIHWMVLLTISHNPARLCWMNGKQIQFSNYFAKCVLFSPNCIEIMYEYLAFACAICIRRISFNAAYRISDLHIVAIEILEVLIVHITNFSFFYVIPYRNEVANSIDADQCVRIEIH